MAIAVPALLVLAYLGVVLWTATTTRSAEDDLSRTQAVLATATSVQADLTDAEANAAGFLLGNAEQSRQLYQERAAAVPAELTQLRQLTAGRPVLAQPAADVDRGARQLLADMAFLMAQPQPAPAEAHAAIVQGGAADAVVLDGVARLRTAVDIVKSQRQAAVDGANSRLAFLGIVAAVLAVLGGSTLSLLFTSQVVGRLRRIGAFTDALAEGRELGPLPGGRDEIGRLADRLSQASALLHQRQQERDAARGDLEDLLTASPVVSFRYDARRRVVTYASPNVERLLGITAEEACRDVGWMQRRVHPDDVAWITRQLRDEPRHDGDRLEMTLRFRSTDSAREWREADAVLTVAVGADGEADLVVAYLVDATERHLAQRAAEERRRLVESIFDASPDTITVRDASGRVVLASRSLADMIGAEHTQAPDALIDAAYDYGEVSEEHRRLVQDMLDRCLQGDVDPAPVVTVGRSAGDGPRIFEIRGRPVLDSQGRVTGTVTVARDVTERARLEESLRRASSDAERASEAKSEFLSRMSHELRTPLNAILGFAQLLELDELPEDQASSVDQIQRAGRHLLALINEVLDISRIEAGRFALSPEAVPVDDILQEVSMLLTPVAEAQGVQLRIDPGPLAGARVTADRQRVLQILLNLGSNGVKYNHRDGTVVFRTGLTRSGLVRFEVSDSGPGIPLDQQHELFVPFSRLGAERSGVEGTGVGLALSKQLVELMGGAIGVESAPGRGSTFWIELQLADPPAGAVGEGPTAARPEGPPPVAAPVTGAPPAAAPPAADAGPPGGPAMTVLHVEDNPSNASLVEQVLARRQGIRLLSASQARLALELARQHHPDLVLLDLHLPDLPGEELLYRLKADPELQDTRVVVLSADATPSRIRRMLSMGVEAYLTKPIDVEALLRLVDDQRTAQR